MFLLLTTLDTLFGKWLSRDLEETPGDSPAPAAASACAAVIPAVCCDPPGSASWLPGGPCAGAAAWLLQWAQHHGGSAETPAPSPGGTAVGTDPCGRAAASGARTLPAGSCRGGGQGGKSFMAPPRGSDKAPPLVCCAVSRFPGLAAPPAFPSPESAHLWVNPSWICTDLVLEKPVTQVA